MSIYGQDNYICTSYNSPIMAVNCERCIETEKDFESKQFQPGSKVKIEYWNAGAFRATTPYLEKREIVGPDLREGRNYFGDTVGNQGEKRVCLVTEMVWDDTNSLMFKPNQTKTVPICLIHREESEQVNPAKKENYRSDKFKALIDCLKALGQVRSR